MDERLRSSVTRALGSEPMPMTPQQFARFIEAEIVRWAAMARERLPGGEWHDNLLMDLLREAADEMRKDADLFSNQDRDLFPKTHDEGSYVIGIRMLARGRLCRMWLS